MGWWSRVSRGSALAGTIASALVGACSVADKSKYTFNGASGVAGGGAAQSMPSSGSSGLGARAGSGASGGGLNASMGGQFTSSMGGQLTSSMGGIGGSDTGSGGATQGGSPTTTVTKTCPKGEHLCVDTCVSNDEVRTCGSSCSPCEAPADGIPTCDGERCGAACPSDKKLCLGACIDLSATCGSQCPAGTHACEGLCPSDTSVNACGKACAPCPVPGGAAQATCDGTKCDFQCLAGYHRCGDRCLLDTDTGGCGAACTVCPTATGGARCLDGVCVIECGDDSHLCGAGCVSNTSPASCGTSCEPCVAPAGGTATCVNGKCGGGCPMGQKLCAGACIPSAQACDGTCSDGSHDCDGLCLSNASTNSCGSSCSPCPLPIGAAQATCDGTKCDFQCAAGYHRCGNRCAPDDDATACGGDCIDCPDDPNGTATCQAGKCGLRCVSTHHECDKKCVANGSVANCGPTSCSACQAPSGGSVSCDGLSCVPVCPAQNTKLCLGACIQTSVACDGMCSTPGTHPCDGLCAASSSVDSCGSRCSPCPAPQNGQSVCNNSTTCGISCPADHHPCNDNGVCASNVSVASCGSSCIACQPPANATATCDGKSCGFVCKSSHTGTNCELPRFQLIPLPSGATSSVASDISSDGQVVVGTLGPPNGAFRWVAPTGAAIALPKCTGATLSSASATNSDGSVVVGSCSGQGFRWTSAGLGLTPRPSSWNHWPTGLSANGNTVVGYQIEDTDPAYANIWTNGSTTLNRIILFESMAEGVSGDGTVVVGHQRPEGGTRQGVWWSSASGVVGLPGTLGVSSFAYGISANGQVIVGSLASTATRWSGAAYGTRESLGSLPSSTTPYGAAFDVSDDGSVVVGYSLIATATYQSVIWMGSGIQRLSEVLAATGVDMQGATLTSVSPPSVSGDGKVVAGTAQVGGVSRAYIGRLP